MIAPDTIEPAALPCVPLDERRALPAQQGIYFVLASDDTTRPTPLNPSTFSRC